MLIKWVLCLTLLVFTSSVGYAFSSKYRKRKLFFSQFYDFNQKFLQELSYSKRPIKEFLQIYPFKGEFLLLLEEYRQKIGRDNFFNEYFSENTFLSFEEEKWIIEYFEQLGKGDSESQKTTFLNRSKDLEIFKKRSEDEYKKYAELYVKLGVLVGLAIIIVII
jgi:stage III sporulation protein AB